MEEGIEKRVKVWKYCILKPNREVTQMMNVSKELTREKLAKVLEGMYSVLNGDRYTPGDFSGRLSDGREWVYRCGEAAVYDPEWEDYIVPTGVHDDDDDPLSGLIGLRCYDLEDDVKALGAFFGVFGGGDRACYMWYEHKIRSLFDITHDTADFFRYFFDIYDDDMREWFADGFWSTCGMSDDDDDD